MSQLSARGNYRDATARDMGEVYSRNLAQRQIFVSEFRQGTFCEDTNAEYSTNDIPDFSETIQAGGSYLNKEAHVEKAYGLGSDYFAKENI